MSSVYAMPSRLTPRPPTGVAANRAGPPDRRYHPASVLADRAAPLPSLPVLPLPSLSLSRLPARPASRPVSRAPSRPVSRAPSRPMSRAPSRPVSRPPSRPPSRPGSRPVSRPSSRPTSRASSPSRRHHADAHTDRYSDMHYQPDVLDPPMPSSSSRLYRPSIHPHSQPLPLPLPSSLSSSSPAPSSSSSAAAGMSAPSALHRTAGAGEPYLHAVDESPRLGRRTSFYARRAPLDGALASARNSLDPLSARLAFEGGAREPATATATATTINNATATGIPADAPPASSLRESRLALLRAARSFRAEDTSPSPSPSPALSAAHARLQASVRHLASSLHAHPPQPLPTARAPYDYPPVASASHSSYDTTPPPAPPSARRVLPARRVQSRAQSRAQSPRGGHRPVRATWAARRRHEFANSRDASPDRGALHESRDVYHRSDDYEHAW